MGELVRYLETENEEQFNTGFAKNIKRGKGAQSD
jgi:hypothetical protein